MQTELPTDLTELSTELTELTELKELTALTELTGLTALTANGLDRTGFEQKYQKPKAGFVLVEVPHICALFRGGNSGNSPFIFVWFA